MDDSFNSSFGGSSTFTNSLTVASSMPNLPGYVSNKPRPKSMKQSFSIVNGVRVEADPNAPKQLNASRSLNSTAFKYDAIDEPEPLPRSKNDMPDLNNASAIWLNKANKVFRFYAYFKEGVNESQAETSRVRKMIITYYQEDGTIEIAERAQENAGMPQGKFVSRRKIPRSGNLDGCYQLTDLYINARIRVFCRTYHIVDCDDATRSALEITDDPEPYPDDEYTTNRAKHMAAETGADLSVSRNVQKSSMKKFMEASLGNTVNNAGRDSFLKNDRNVLRFTGVWDDQHSMFGDLNFYTLHYYLADNTVEVLEQHQANNGKDPYPLLLKRAPLPKGMDTPDPNGRADESNPDSFVQWQDLDVQKVVKVFGRDVLLISADTTTRNFYADNGLQLADNIDDKYMDVPESIPRNAVPPHSGFGSEEDSLASCGALVPKPPKTEFDKQGVHLPSTVLRFQARMDTNSYDDKDRLFVILYYLATKEASVREPPQRNSGIVGGMFLSKRALYKPNGERFMASDFYAGARVKLLSTNFIINDVDEYTLKHMDSDPAQFPLADPNFCLKKISDIMQEAGISAETLFSALDKNGDSKIGVGEFLPMIKELLKDNGINAGAEDFPDQIAITIFRKFDVDKSGFISIEEFCGAL